METKTEAVAMILETLEYALNVLPVDPLPSLLNKSKEEMELSLSDNGILQRYKWSMANQTTLNMVMFVCAVHAYHALI